MGPMKESKVEGRAAGRGDRVARALRTWLSAAWSVVSSRKTARLMALAVGATAATDGTTISAETITEPEVRVSVTALGETPAARASTARMEDRAFSS